MQGSVSSQTIELGVTRPLCSVLLSLTWPSILKVKGKNKASKQIFHVPWRKDVEMSIW